MTPVFVGPECPIQPLRAFADAAFGLLIRCFRDEAHKEVFNLEGYVVVMEVDGVKTLTEGSGLTVDQLGGEIKVLMSATETAKAAARGNKRTVYRLSVEAEGSREFILNGPFVFETLGGKQAKAVAEASPTGPVDLVLTASLGSGFVTSVFGRTGDVVAQTGDYTFTQVGADKAGAAAAAQIAAESASDPAGTAVSVGNEAKAQAKAETEAAQKAAEAASDPKGSATTAETAAKAYAKTQAEAAQHAAEVASDPAGSATAAQAAAKAAAKAEREVLEAETVKLTGNQTVAGVKTFSSSPAGPEPATAEALATKGYVDAHASGLKPHPACLFGTATPLSPANTYAANVLTATENGVLVVDGKEVKVGGTRILVKNEENAAHNGIYFVSTVGGVSEKYKLTRVADMDEASEVAAAYTFVENGTENGNSGWTVLGTGPWTIGTTPIEWTLFSKSGEVKAGTGLEKSGETLNVEYGTTAGTAAQGNDSRITGAASKAELGAYAPLASPALTGNPTVPNQPEGENNTKAANTAFAHKVATTAESNAAATATERAEEAQKAAEAKSIPAAKLGVASGAASLDIGGHVPVGQIPTGVYAPLESPALTGNPTAPTQAEGDSSTRLATTNFVHKLLAAVEALTEAAANLKYLRKSENLKDVESVPTARTNLGLGTAATKNSGEAGGVASLEVGTGKVPASQLPTSNVSSITQPLVISGTPAKGEVLEATGPEAAGWSPVTVGEEALSPLDPRVKTPIDLTGASFSDVGFQELLDLASTPWRSIAKQGVGSIAWPAKAKVKLQAQHGCAGVVHTCANTPEDGPIWEWPNTAFSSGATGTYAVVSQTGVWGGDPKTTLEQATVKLVGVNGTFAASGTVLIAGKPVTYTSVSHVEGAGTESKTWLEGCKGVVAYGRAWVLQGAAFQVAGGAQNRSQAQLPYGLRIIGPGIGSATLWGSATEPAGLDGVWLDTNTAIACTIKGFRHNALTCAERVNLEQGYNSEYGYSGFAMKLPVVIAPNVYIDRIRINNGWWCGVWIDNNTYISGQIYNSEWINTPWSFWKDAYNAVWGPSKLGLYYLTVDGLNYEAAAGGVFGCPDGLGEVKSSQFRKMLGSFAEAPGKEGGKIKWEALFVGKLDTVDFSSALTLYENTLSPLFKLFTGKNVTLPDIIPTQVMLAPYTGASPDLRGRGMRWSYGNIANSNEEAIPSGAVMSGRSEEKVQQYEGGIQAVVGVAIKASEKKAIPIQTSGEVTVNVRKQSTPPTSPEVEKNTKEPSTLKASETFFAKLVAETAEGGLSAASAEVGPISPTESQSLKFKCKLPALQHGQKWTHFRVYISSTGAGKEEGYILSAAVTGEAGEAVEVIWSGAAKVGVTVPPTTNVGVEIYGINWVRGYGAGATGCACVASSRVDTEGYVFARTYSQPDNGETAKIEIAANAPASIPPGAYAKPESLGAKVEEGPAKNVGVRLEDGGSDARWRGTLKIKAGEKLKPGETLCTLKATYWPAFAKGLNVTTGSGTLVVSNRLLISTAGVVTMAAEVLEGEEVFLDGEPYAL